MFLHGEMQVATPRMNTFHYSIIGPVVGTATVVTMALATATATVAVQVSALVPVMVQAMATELVTDMVTSMVTEGEEAMTMLFIDVTETADRHGAFHARLNGRLLCTSRTPFLTASRVLVKEGVDPDTTLAMRHVGCRLVTLTVRLGDAAKLMVREQDRPPQFAPYQSFDAGWPQEEATVPPKTASDVS